jgi:AcrR family transcriptional regulator
MSKPEKTGKRVRTRARILANAITLFRGQGVRPTRLAEVARESDISLATLFNYFPTKGVIAEAWVRGEVREVLSVAIGEAVANDRSLRSAVRAASRGLAATSACEAKLRLEAWREAGRADSPALGEDARLVDGLRKEQQREHVRADLEASALASMLMDAIEGGLIAGLRECVVAAELAGPGAEVESAAPLARTIQGRVDLVLDGARKRNERVTLAAAKR